jgi:uncharacterized protein (DUF885 family)
MHRSTVSILALAACLLAVNFSGYAQAPATQQPSAPAAAPSSTPVSVADKAWVVRSNQYTQMLLDVQRKHSPESSSAQGLENYDSSITDATRADEIAQRKELEDILAQLKKVEAKEQDRNVREDLEILQNIYSLQFREEDYRLNHRVTFLDASSEVFVGLSSLLNDQVSQERRPAALIRLRKYAGEEPGFKPFTDVVKQRMMEQMAKPGVIYPSISEMESQLERNTFYINNLRSLFVTCKLTGWQTTFIKLQQELGDYDTWVRGTVMPKGRTDSRLSPEEYAFSLQSFDIDQSPEQLASQAHAAFTGIQSEMAPLAAEVAKQHGWSVVGYRDVIRQLKLKEVTGDDILPLYKARLKAIEEIVTTKNLVTLPARPVALRLLTTPETESEQVPAAHFVPPPLIHNTGQTGEFVLPLHYHAALGGSYRIDDYTYDAVTWPMTAHEARPGDDLEFNAILEHGVSLARLLYAFNSTNTDSWGLYAEWLVQPYEPADGQLITLQLRLLRAARAFLDSELQSGKTTPQDATKLLENDVVLSPAYARQEVSQFASRPPGQANSYFFGYTTMLQLRKDTEAALGAKFDARQFHDFLLAQGLLTPDLLRKAVMEVFVPAEKKKK